MKSFESTQWQQTIFNELNSHIINGIWNFLELPFDRRLITWQWIFKLKFKSTSIIDRYKAPLVYLRFSQISDLDINEIFLLIICIHSIHLILALASQKNLHIHQMVVKTDFFHGILREESYMQVPEGIIPPRPGMRYKFHKTLYGLKQSLREWYKVIDTFLISLGFINSMEDGNVYYLHKISAFAILTLYVDDTLIACNNLPLLQHIKTQLHGCFFLSNLRKAHHLLSLQITWDINEGCIRISQTLYLQQKLVEFGFQNAPPVSTPRVPGLSISAADCQATSSPLTLMIPLDALLPK